MKYLSALLICGLCLVTGYAEQDFDNFSLWQGTFSKNEKGQILRGEETTKIPFITRTMDPLFGHGFILKSHDKSDFACRVHVVFPKPTKATLPDGSIKELTEYDSKSEMSKNGAYLNVYTFDENDAFGIYKVTIFVNEKQLTELEFDVQPPG